MFAPQMLGHGVSTCHMWFVAREGPVRFDSGALFWEAFRLWNY